MSDPPRGDGLVALIPATPPRLAPLPLSAPEVPPDEPPRLAPLPSESLPDELRPPAFVVPVPSAPVAPALPDAPVAPRRAGGGGEGLRHGARRRRGLAAAAFGQRAQAAQTRALQLRHAAHGDIEPARDAAAQPRWAGADTRPQGEHAPLGAREVVEAPAGFGHGFAQRLLAVADVLVVRALTPLGRARRGTAG